MEGILEPHLIKTFNDVVQMYHHKGELLRSEESTAGAGPAFYTFQRNHPAYNSISLKKFDELRSNMILEDALPDNAGP